MHIDVATERIGESARSKAGNAIYVETVKSGFNRDEGDKWDKRNPRILFRHSGQSVARTRNPSMPVIARSGEVVESDAAILVKSGFCKSGTS